MNLRIDSFSASFNYRIDSFHTIVERLESEGYRPLIRKLAQELCDVVGGTLDDLNSPESTEEVDFEISSDINRRKLLGLEKLGYKWGLDGIRGLARVPELKGELFLADDSENILLLTILDASQGKHGKLEGHHHGVMRVGIVGASPDAVLLDLFKADIASVLGEGGDVVEWHADNIENAQFKEFLSAEEHAIHVLAAGITEREMKSAKALESTGVRDVATTIRKSGVILAKELLRSKPDTAADTVKYVDQLIQADLLHQEYVVICSKSGAHVNRVEHRETIDQMAKLGVLCSCGKRISDEAIEGLLSTDEMLPKMLDKNYWMTVSVVRALLALGVPSEKILLNPSVVNDDVEILADLDGTLLMFNLKDAEYGIPHALSFTTRIGMHRPQMAFLVSTKGVSSDVKDHFKRVKLDTQMVYIANLLQLDATLKKVVEGIRMMRVKTWFDTFQSMMNFGLTPLLLQRLDLGKAEPKQNPAASLMDSIRAKANTRQTIVETPAVTEPVQEAHREEPSPQPFATHSEVGSAPRISAVEPPAPQAPQPNHDSQAVYTAPEPITETLETSYSHHDVTAELDDVEFGVLDLPMPTHHDAEPQHHVESYSEPEHISSTVQSAPSAASNLSPAAIFSQSPFADDISDSDVAVSELEELISEARESKISSEIDHVMPSSAMEFFAHESNGSNGASEMHEVPQAPPINPYKRVMEMLNPQPQVVTSVIIDEPEKAPSAMDILDNVLEAVASNENAQAVPQPAKVNQATGNIFTNQYMNYGAQQVAQHDAASTDEEEEQPVATY